MKVHQKRLLDQGKTEKLVDALRAIPSANPEVAEKIRIEAGYLERNAERMRYPKFRRQHLFVGSGVIEAGCKSVIGSRLKPSGMRHARKRVLDRARSKRHPGPALLPSQRPVRDLLGGAPDCLIVTSMSHTRRALRIREQCTLGQDLGQPRRLRASLPRDPAAGAGCGASRGGACAPSPLGAGAKCGAARPAHASRSAPR